MSTTSADIVVINGRIRTLDSSGSVRQAMAIVDDRIAAIGDDDEIRDLVGRGTEVIDAGGRTVLPAFVDSHTHLRRASLVLAFYLDFMALRPASVADVLEAVRGAVARREPGAWVQGDSLDAHRLAERRFPDRYELDSVAPENPVVLRGVGRHIIAANSLALRAAGIDRDTVSPVGGRIERDDQGEPTGVLHEQAKLRLDAARGDSVVPVPTDEERVSALASAMSLLHQHGIAGVHEMAREPNDIADYLRLREQGSLGVRVLLYVRGIEAQTKLADLLGLGLRTGFGDEWVRLGGVKFSIDGAERIHNAALYEAYPGEPDNRGLVRIPPDELTEAVCAAHRGGLEVAVHAIGPRAVDVALDAFEAAMRQGSGARRLHHRVEHAYLPPQPGQLKRMADLGLVWSTQPAFLYEGAESWLETFGEQRCRSAMPLRTGTELGLRIQLNSDYPCSTMNPFVALQAAVTRTTERGAHLGLDEAIPVETALRYMTRAASTGMSDADLQGSLAPGSFADVIITSADPVSAVPDELSKITTVLTIVGGRPVYRAI